MSVQKASRDRRTTKRKIRFVSSRTDTVRILAELVDRENVVHVRELQRAAKRRSLGSLTVLCRSEEVHLFYQQLEEA
ncbi:hypothetical protein BJX64DRAFT_190503 [Aspergillus heterothallicus]